MGEVTRANVEKLLNGDSDSIALKKYQQVSEILGESNVANMGEKIITWVSSFGIPKLGAYGLKAEDAPTIAKLSMVRENPVAMSDDEKTAILLERI